MSLTDVILHGLVNKQRIESKMFSIVIIVLDLTLICIVSGCTRIGDPQSQRVEYKNNSGVLIRIYHRMGQEKTGDRVLAPGETARNQFIVGPREWWGSTPPMQVEATDQNGSVIFCRRYRLEELDQLGWKVEIVNGALHCSPA
jgi:hypothetical protein